MDPDFSGINLNKNNIALEYNYVVAADSIADAEISIGAKTAQMRIDMTTTNEFVSPMIDLQRSSMTLVDNVIDNQDSAASAGFNVPMNFVNETAATGGTSPSKHITTVTQLAQSAVGLKVFITAHRPKPANFKLYYRTATDNDLINTLEYTEVTSLSNNPPDEDIGTFREYEYLIGGIGGTLPAFTKFQLKIVMTSTNSAKVPIIRDLRAIALSV